MWCWQFAIAIFFSDPFDKRTFPRTHHHSTKPHVLSSASPIHCAPQFLNSSLDEAPFHPSFSRPKVRPTHAPNSPPPNLYPATINSRVNTKPLSRPRALVPDLTHPETWHRTAAAQPRASPTLGVLCRAEWRHDVVMSISCG
jgi:hypothetical protein